MQPFIGTDDLSAILGRTVTDQDLITAIALDSGSQSVRSFIQQTINFVANDKIELDGRGRQTLRLPERPIRKLTEVSVEGVVLDPDTYDLRSSLLRRLGDTWPLGIANVSVTYDHGYDIQPDDSSGDDVLVPADMRLVALLAARRVYTSVGADEGIKQSETIGKYTYSNSTTMVVQTAAELLGPEQQVLHRYKITPQV